MSGSWARDDWRFAGSEAIADDDDEVHQTVLIGSAMGQLLRQRGLEEALILGRITGCWDQVVGADIARQVRPHLVRGRELVVLVDHPAWATELEFAGKAVLGRLAEHLGDGAPERLSVRVVPGSHG